MLGKVILVEGSDCSFKETNSIALYENLKNMGYDVRKYHFPNYESPSAALVKMYLSGALGDNASQINPYVASQFYAVDRVASYITEWKDFYLNGGIVVLDRYVESNAIHQGAKFTDIAEKNKFLNWVHNLEYNLNKLPKPDIVFFMDMPPIVAQAIMSKRGNKIDNGKLDIHEKDKNFMQESYKNAKYVANKFGWHTISCIQKGKVFLPDTNPLDIVKTKETLAQEILQKALEVVIGKKSDCVTL